MDFYTFANPTNEMEFKQKFVRSKILKSFCRFVYLRISETIRSLSGSSSKRRYLDISTLQARTEHSSKGRTHAAASVANTKAISARNSRCVSLPRKSPAKWNWIGVQQADGTHIFFLRRHGTVESWNSSRERE